MPNLLVTELNQAVSHHNAGEFGEAERHYLNVLRQAPDHAEANHNLGVLKVQANQPESALPHFLAALESDTSNGQYWIGYIDALHKAGQGEDAKLVLELARRQGLTGDKVSELAERLGVAPAATSGVEQAAKSGVEQAARSDAVHDSDAAQPEKGASQTPARQEIDRLLNLFGQGRFVDAAGAAQELTMRYPGHEFGWKALGAVYKQMNRAADALYPMQRAAELAPDDVEAHYNLGVTLQELGRLEDAQSAYLNALRIDPDYADAHGNLGVVQQELGNLAAAEQSYRSAILFRPGHIGAHSNLVSVLRAQKKFDDAAACCSHLLTIAPGSAHAHNDMGDVLKDMGRLNEAQERYRQALSIDPAYAEAHYKLANALQASGDVEEAREHYLSALQIRPGYAEANYNLGRLLKQIGQSEEACIRYRAALETRPDFFEASYNLANTEKAIGRLHAAEAAYRQALAARPYSAEANYNLACVLADLGRPDDAIAYFRRTVQIDPDYFDAHFSLGNALLYTGRLSEAEDSYRHALALNADIAGTHSNLGLVLQELGRLEEAEQSYQHALRLDPNFAEVHNNLGGTFQKRGLVDEAAACFRQALASRHDFEIAHSNLIFTQDLMTKIDPATLSDERRRWNEVHAAHLRQHRPFLNVPDPDRRLRIGYVSADFRVHSAAYAFGAMLSYFDRDNFEVYAYSNNAATDELTRQFQQSVTCWRSIFGLSDDAVADMVMRDQIDILVDLSGHTAGNRLLVFARKPAPIQISAWGYAAGTGMSAMDVLFSDRVFVPEEERHLYAEEIVYLSSAIGFYEPHRYPEVNALPACSNGHITFGSFNRLAKSSPEVYEVWAQVLQAVPGSRMILKTAALDDEPTRARVLGYFREHGIEESRIVMQGQTSRDDHLAAFNQVDIALDPFPHGGGVTALEGLMMGVPMVTLKWPTLPGRVSSSILTSLNLSDWIADTREQYVEIAVDKARDLQSLADLRGSLRGVFNSSALGDSRAYVRAAEGEYRRLWRRWCASGGTDGQ